MKQNANQVSDSFKFLLPLIENELLDSQEIFILGYSLGKRKQKNFNHIINTMAKLLALRKFSNIKKDNLDAVYSLMTEQNWNTVIIFNILLG